MAKRNPDGTWAKGVSGNPGGISTYRRDMRRALREAVTESDWNRIARRAVDDAANGNRHARRWLSEYLLGLPEHIKETPEDAMTPEQWKEAAKERLRSALEDME